MARKVKAQATPVKVPQSREEAAEFIRMIGIAQRERQRVEARLNDDVEALKAQAERVAKHLALMIESLAQGLEIWAAANRDALTEGGKRKTAELATGELRWRMTPPAVAIKSAKAVISALMTHGLDRFLRRKIEVDKEAILKEPEAVAGIAGLAISQREEFVIVPNETKLEEVRS